MYRYALTNRAAISGGLPLLIACTNCRYDEPWTTCRYAPRNDLTLYLNDKQSDRVCLHASCGYRHNMQNLGLAQAAGRGEPTAVDGSWTRAAAQYSWSDECGSSQRRHHTALQHCGSGSRRMYANRAGHRRLAAHEGLPQNKQVTACRTDCITCKSAICADMGTTLGERKSHCTFVGGLVMSAITLGTDGRELAAHTAQDRAVLHAPA